MSKIDSPLHHHSVLKRASTLALCALGLILTLTKVGFAQTLKPMIISVSSPREISAAPMLMEVKQEHADAIYDDMIKVFLPNGKIDLNHLAASYDDARKQVPQAAPLSLTALVDYSLLDEIRSAMR